jgi:hypothetical protein
MSDFKADLARGHWDIEFFALRFLGIRVHPGQVRFLKALLTRNHTKWRAAYLTILLSAGNRAGKTLAMTIAIAHSCIYKVGKKPPGSSDKDFGRWMKAEYTAFHFAIQQEIAELVFMDLVKIASGTHEGQINGTCPLTDEIGQWATWDKKYQGEYRHFVFHEMLGGAQIHFRTTSERGLGSLGRDMDLITYDECAHDSHLDFVFGEVLNLRRMGTGGQLILASTPTEGITGFSDLWETGNPEAPDRAPDRMAVRMSTRDNVGYGLQQDVFDRLVADMPEELVKQNIEGYFIEGRTNYFSALKVDEAFKDDLPELQTAKHLHVYAQGVDAALTYDSSWSVVLDSTDYRRGKPVVGVKVTRQRGSSGKTTDSIVALASDSHNAYTSTKPNLRASCATAIDATGFGGKMFREALDGISPLRAIEFGGSKQKKLKLLGDLKTAIDQGKLIMPRHGLWLVGRRQMAGYKLADRGIEQDFVMALACAWAEVRRSGGPDDGQVVTFNPFAPERDVPRGTPSWLRDDLNTDNAWSRD